MVDQKPSRYRRHTRRSVAMTIGLAVAAVFVVAVGPHRVWQPAAGLSDTPGLSTSRANVVVVMTDDLDVATTRAALDLNLMPNLSSYIIDQGTDFAESYVTNPLCCPSRATYLTGQYAHNNGTYTNESLSGTVIAMDDSSTLPTWLQNAGYRTAHVGKYLNGYGAFLTSKTVIGGVEVPRAVWDQVVGLENRLKLEPNYVPPGWDSWYGLIDATTYCVYNYALNENGLITFYLKNGDIYRDSNRIPPELGYGTADNYQTDILARRSVDFLLDVALSTPEQPFFLSVLPLAPHVEACEWSNMVFKGTSAEDDGPLIKDLEDDYRNQFRSTIRPAPRHAAIAAPVAAMAAQYLPLHPSFNEQDLSDKPQALQDRLMPLDEADKNNLYNQFGDRMASLMAVDNLIGAIVQTLEATGQLSNTVLIFTSDNGWFNGNHRLSSKYLGYEEAVRVPLFVRMPSGSSQLSPRAVLNNDLALTIADLAGALPSLETDGRSLLPLLLDPIALPWRQRFLLEHFQSEWPHSLTYHLIPPSSLGVKTTAESPVPNRVYIQTYAGVQYRDGYYLNSPPWGELGFPTTPPDLQFAWEAPVIASELYDMSADQFQLDNLLYDLESRPEPEKQQILQEQLSLQQMLMDLAACQGDGCRDAENR